MGWLGRLLGTEATPHAVVHVTDQTFRAEVERSELPVVLDVWSVGCGPCKLLEPVVMELSRQYQGRVKVAELEVSQAPLAARKLGVTATPTVLYLRKGRVVERAVGYRAGHYHREVIEHALLGGAARAG